MTASPSAPDERSSTSSERSAEGRPPEGPLDRCAREIRALHRFFEGWLSGRLSDTGEAFRRLDRALAADFSLIHPSGEERSRTDIVAGLRRAHGQRPGLTIEIRDVRLRAAGDELLAATYEEWQFDEETNDGRLSTVLFARDEEGPNGLRWVHVHETWLQTPGE